jgi:hypothetical protein
MHIRSYTDLDLDGVLGCFRRSVHGLGARYYTAEQVAVWAPAALDVEAWRERLRTGCTLIAEIEGALAGFVRVEANGYVDLIYVDPAFARRASGERCWNGPAPGPLGRALHGLRPTSASPPGHFSKRWVFASKRSSRSSEEACC